MLAGVFAKKADLRIAAIASLIAISAVNSGLSQELVRTKERPRILAPDAMEVISPDAQPGETTQGPVDLPLVTRHPELAWKPNFAPESDTLIEMSKRVVFRSRRSEDAIYCLEFAFKPVRMVQVGDKLVWYLLYRVRYLGGDLQAKADTDDFGNEIFNYPQAVSRPKGIAFFPTFLLTSLSTKQQYLDQILPQAKAVIMEKERVGKPIYDSVEMQRIRILKTTEAENNEVWGVATWTDVDPRTDFFTVQVRGLTNAQKLKTGGDKLEYLQKILLLRFSRPGDTVNEIEDIIRFGVPAIEDPARQKYILDKYGIKERLDYEWIYR
jgi:hypothetical protein